MKKLILIAAVMFAYVIVARADQVNTPQGTGNALQTADYGGVDVATSVFTISSYPIAGELLVYGVIFSSGNCNDFVTFKDSTSVLGWSTAQTEVFRIYNTANSTVGVTSTAGSVCGGLTALKYPVRLYNGMVFAPSVATYNSVSVLYYKRNRSKGRY